MKHSSNKVTPYGYQQIKSKIVKLENTRKHTLEIIKKNEDSNNYTNNQIQKIDNQINYFKQELAHAEIVRPNKKNEVNLGNLVKVEFLNGHERELFQVVGTLEAELAQIEENKISFLSPLGKSLMKKKVGNISKVIAPDVQYLVKIINIK